MTDLPRSAEAPPDSTAFELGFRAGWAAVFAAMTSNFSGTVEDALVAQRRERAPNNGDGSRSVSVGTSGNGDALRGRSGLELATGDLRDGLRMSRETAWNLVGRMSALLRKFDRSEAMARPRTENKGKGASK